MSQRCASKVPQRSKRARTSSSFALSPSLGPETRVMAKNIPNYRDSLISEVRSLWWPLSTATARGHLLLKRYGLTGVYHSRNEALAAIPKRALRGYDHEAVVKISQESMTQLKEWDYPVLLWLERIIQGQTGQARLSLLDAGGHVGTKYYAFQRLLALKHIDWTVLDLPAVVKAGEELAKETGAPLQFQSDLAAVGAVDILLCSGFLQYYDRTLVDFITQLSRAPQHLIINKLPVRDDAEIFTLERIGPARVPYRIFNQTAFEQQIADLGYTIADQWTISGLSRWIISHPDQGATKSVGYYLTRD